MYFVLYLLGGFATWLMIVGYACWAHDWYGQGADGGDLRFAICTYIVCMLLWPAIMLLLVGFGSMLLVTYATIRLMGWLTKA